MKRTSFGFTMIYIFKKKIMGLRITITRLERTLNLSESRKHRHLRCSHYERCLDKVIKKKWESFSCAKCARFKAFLEEQKRLNEERSKIRITEEVFKFPLGGFVYDKNLI